jgi:uncharacterized protein (DUF697 family)
MEIVMFRKTLAAALTVAIVAGSAVTAPTTASAANGRNFAAVVGLIAGAAIATAVSNRAHSDEYSHRGDDCFEKQTTRWNSYGERVIGYTTICR